MAPSSEEHLRRIAEQERADAEGAGGRSGGRTALLLGLALVLFMAVGAGVAWWAMSAVPGAVMAVVDAIGVGDESAGGDPGNPGSTEGAAGESEGTGARLMQWWLGQQAANLGAPSDEAAPAEFEIAEGEALPAIAARLEFAGLIRSADAFRLLARAQGVDTQVQAGKHTLRRNMSAEEVLAALLVAQGEAVTVRIPEGNRAEEIATILANQGLVDRSEFLTLVGAGVDPGVHPGLADRPEGASLEGYLFPDTYELDPKAGTQAVLGRLLDNFEARVTPEMRAQAAVLQMPLYEVVTLASIVEREAGVEEERGKIARVYLNRLASPPYILNADPTVQYALGFQPEANAWWKRPLYTEDLQIDSAYNSYTNPGLPPGPIASPSLASIEAVLSADPGPWMYFVANDVACDGTHVFGETYDEHLRNVATYQTGECGR